MVPLDMRKLTAVREDIATRVESSEESYALAARAKGYNHVHTEWHGVSDQGRAQDCGR